MALGPEEFAAIARSIGLDEHDLKFDQVGGGDTAGAFALTATDGMVFVKVLPLGQAGLLSAEADGLEAIAATGVVRVPRVVRRGMLDDKAWLALEYLQLDSNRSPRCDARLGQQLAQMHRNTAESFGWHRNNYIGRTPQLNTDTDEWSEFFGRYRLLPQFDRLRRKLPDSSWKELRDEVVAAWETLSATHRPPPSLVHGDLWHGNAAATAGDEPVVFDPAVHYADRECDLAMAHLFGGFDEAFYRSYDEAWPLPHGFERRRLFYKLYHILNHANLFEGSYLDAAGKLCRRILEE